MTGFPWFDFLIVLLGPPLGGVIALTAAFAVRRNEKTSEQALYVRQLREQAYLAFIREHHRLVHCITTGDESTTRGDFGDSLEMLYPSVMLFGSKKAGTLALGAVGEIYERDTAGAGGKAFRELVRRELGVHDL